MDCTDKNHEKTVTLVNHVSRYLTVPGKREPMKLILLVVAARTRRYCAQFGPQPFSTIKRQSSRNVRVLPSGVLL